jgi:hypothetical protein
MKFKSLLLGIGMIFLSLNQTPPALSQSLQIDGKEYPIIDSLVITIDRGVTETPPITYPEVSSDGRYELLKVLPAITRELQVEPPPAPRRLYRMAEVRDRQTNKVLTVAIPIQL